MLFHHLNGSELNWKVSDRSSLAGRFAKNTDGNIAMMFMFMSMTLFLFVGGAVDYTRWHSVRTDMIESMDAASLALARYAQENPDLDADELQLFGKQFFNENFNYEQYIYNTSGQPVGDGESIVSFNLTDDAVVSACVEGRLNTYLLRVASIKYFEVDQCVQITKFGRGRVELALVLDVTGSMNRDEDDNFTSVDEDRKITKLKDAVDNMLDVMFETDATSQNVQIGIVPFNAYVNAGGASSWQDSWGDQGANAAYHGAHFFHVTEDGEIDMDTKVNHYTLYDSADETWEGCVEARPYPLDELDTPPGLSTTTAIINTYNTAPTGTTDSRTLTAFSRAPNLNFSTGELASADNSRFVPMFYPDEPDCNSGWQGRCPSYANGTSYWNRSSTIDIGGVNVASGYARYWFSDPSDSGYNRNDYDNNNFIDDDLYTSYSAGEPAYRYAHIVKKYRNLRIHADASGPTTTDEQEWKTFLADLGADEYWNDDIDSDNYSFVGTSADDFGRHLYDSDFADYHEFIMRNAYVGWWNDSTDEYDYKYDLGSSNSDNPNRNCPVEVLPLTNVREDIEDHMDLLSPNGNTNTAVGTVWGWRVVSDAAPFTEGAANDDSDWQKAVVIMTDGANTTGWRNTPWGTDMTTYGYGREERMGVGVDEGGGDSNWDSDEMRDHMNEKMLRTCARMKEEGILVYTIVFGLDDSTTEAVFESCATEPNAPYYFKAPSGEQLEQAFGDIAADLVDLHISE